MSPGGPEARGEVEVLPPGGRGRACYLERGGGTLPPGASWRLVSGFPRDPAWAPHSFPLPGAAGQGAGFRTQGAPGIVVPGCFMETFWPHSCAYGIPIFSPLLRGPRSEIRISKRDLQAGVGPASEGRA